MISSPMSMREDEPDDPVSSCFQHYGMVEDNTYHVFRGGKS
jgi:hypothetical protein